MIEAAAARSRAYAAAATFAAVALGPTGAARAGRHDLALLKLCSREPSAAMAVAAECSWVKRDAASGVIVSPVRVDPAAETRFRSLMSELGAVMAPRLQTPADTLGFSGFQVTAEIGATQIHNQAPYWDGVEGVSSAVPGAPAGRPDAWLTTVGGFVRKGIWLPLPAFEIGAGAVNLVGSRMIAAQGYAKLALHEGFHDWVLPSLAVRGGVSRVTGANDVQLTIGSFDISVSKAFGVGGTARLEPFGGVSFLFIDARSEVIDATPSCDAYAAAQGSTAGRGGLCADAQTGRGFNDLNANFVFPDQDVITRTRLFAGFKLKVAVAALVAEYQLTRAGESRDGARRLGAPTGAKDESGGQHGVSLSAGLDF